MRESFFGEPPIAIIDCTLPPRPVSYACRGAKGSLASYGGAMPARQAVKGLRLEQTSLPLLGSAPNIRAIGGYSHDLIRGGGYPQAHKRTDPQG